MQKILGIEISKKKHDIILVIEGKKYHKEISNDAKGFGYLKRWLRVHQATYVHACLEATGQYGEAIAEWLFEQDHTSGVKLNNETQKTNDPDC